MRILVSAASKHGATAEMAQVIADELRVRGVAVDLQPPEDVASVEPYDAFVLGSGVYAGRWLGPAKELIERNREQLAGRPVWLFSSGPIGQPPKPAELPPDGVAMAELTHARDHRVFAGRIDRADMAFGERVILSALRAPEGDFRPWTDIRAWAAQIAESLMAPVGAH